MLRLVTLLLSLALIWAAGSADAQVRRDMSDQLLAHAPPDMLFQESLAPAPAQSTKSPAKAFLFSALFPGAGELYAGRKRGLFFSALEIGGLTTYIVLHQRGDDRKKGVYAFANAHWDSTRCAPGCVDPSNGTESLGPYGSQQYYEQIGKYDKFQEGWDDYSPGSAGLSPNRKVYVGMRHTMNRAFKWANWSAGVLLFNHAVSAFHAALLVRSRNRAGQVQESRLRIGVQGYNQFGDWAPAAVVSYAF